MIDKATLAISDLRSVLHTHAFTFNYLNYAIEFDCVLVRLLKVYLTGWVTIKPVVQQLSGCIPKRSGVSQSLIASSLRERPLWCF